MGPTWAQHGFEDAAFQSRFGRVDFGGAVFVICHWSLQEIE